MDALPLARHTQGAAGADCKLTQQALFLTREKKQHDDFSLTRKLKLSHHTSAFKLPAASDTPKFTVCE